MARAAADHWVATEGGASEARGAPAGTLAGSTASSSEWDGSRTSFLTCWTSATAPAGKLVPTSVCSAASSGRSAASFVASGASASPIDLFIAFAVLSCRSIRRAVCPAEFAAHLQLGHLRHQVLELRLDHVAHFFLVGMDAIDQVAHLLQLHGVQRHLA